MAKQRGGKRAGARRAARPKPRFNPVIAGLALAITLCVVAWGYLVKAAIDFGTSARDGDGGWLFLGLACLGAAACLFVGLILVAKLLAAIGLLPEAATGPDPRASAREADQHLPPAPRQPSSASETLTLPLPKQPGTPSGRPTAAPRYQGGKRAAR
ncbi:hypothetical protein [Nocardioides sp. AE5]|uniref:hypothetical protein n=1 Tax=Nocardioides sp. AE5 TaxID=2962573 RepID=UPI00288146AA|nr:hypothetical protein [Nocardioides sp. AE5]MDT0203837.1 hypothetical protein [Nocardioides sp. AE5]